ncbi:hypothetical protein [Burkholderia lata]|uniref:hypothetical protein n=1 Tax=Burkholderia lata (strain ATCC 17760 / DSM 23089 / LMG 22485 / NCIMB 9086 / R18194 / 383) TaxID=482957 RepID=UPI001582E538|nr:hypothetical protein [Burkholderia lata]
MMKWILGVALTLNFMAPTGAEAQLHIPVNRGDQISRTFDRANPGSDLKIWSRAPGGGYSKENVLLYGKNVWLCDSSTDASVGACSVEKYNYPDRSRPPILLNFEEVTTKSKVTLKVRAFKEYWWPAPFCNDADEFASQAGVLSINSAITNIGKTSCKNTKYIEGGGARSVHQYHLMN